MRRTLPEHPRPARSTRTGDGHRRRIGRALTGIVATLTAGALLLPGTAATADPAPSGTDVPAYGAPDQTAADYYEALLRHTRWVDTVWDASAGVYQARDMNFAVVLGNAVLLTHGEYDAELAGTSKEQLRERTLATIEHYAASNRLVNASGTWGRQLFWESTFQSYFLLAGRLLWDELDATTRDHLTTIAAEQSRYTADLDFGRDPLSGGWNAHWPTGGHRGDTALEEVGVYTQALAPGLAWAPGDPDADRWADQLGTWGRNAAGQPTADRNNPTVVAGAPVSSNTMQNVWDSYLVENHGSFGPHYQSDIWRSGARNAIHFLLAGEEIPEILLEQPNSAELWRSIQLVMSDQGEPLMPMVADREFLYGRDVLPIAFLGQVLRDPHAARAEANLAAALADYQMHEPVYRLTKFSGEPKYEPEARAEIAISYLLHVESARSAEGPVEPTPQDEFFAALAGVRDFGQGPGITVQQSARAWAGALDREGFVKFPWVPEHDSWLFHISGRSPFLYPTTNATVDERSVQTYTGPRDGFEGTASLFRIGDHHAGQVTLPTGSAIYASSGAGAGDGEITVRNLDMGGYNGLDGSRTYTTAEGSTTASMPEPVPTDPADANAARIDEHTFDPVTARFVRMQGEQGHPQYGYSMYAFHAYAPDSDTDVASGASATASSEDSGPGRTAQRVTDGNPSTRWAVAVSQRSRPDSWIQVDLGEETTVDTVRLAWEASAGARYRVQTSVDGESWTTVGEYHSAPEDVNVSRLDRVELVPPGAEEPAPVSTRFVRMLGERGHPEFGYSLYHLRAFSPDGTDVAAGATASASSAEGAHPASAVTDRSASTRWAVVRAERGRPDSWVQVDLGVEVEVSHVELGWESAAGREYVVQTSSDGVTWHDAVRYEYTGDQVLSTDAGWVNVEGKGGFVPRGTDAPSTVSQPTDTQHTIRLAGGPDGRRLVEMVVGDAATTASYAERPLATSDDEGLLVSDLDGYVSLFNVGDEDVTASVTVPHDGADVPLYEGTQSVGTTSTTLEVAVPAGVARVLAPRAFVGAGQLPEHLEVAVEDGRTLAVEARATSSTTLEVRNAQTGEVRAVELAPSGTDPVRVKVAFVDATPFPVPDHALSALTFPASVLPAGMTSPALAVDGDPGTSWVPGPDGRMVTDLGAPRAIGDVVAVWDGEDVPALTVSTSADGLDFAEVASVPAGQRTGMVTVDDEARYVAVTTTWSEGDAGLASLHVLAPGAAGPGEPGGLGVEATVETRCVAGRVTLAVRAVNGGDETLDVTLATPFGSRTVTGVEPGAVAYQSFATRSVEVAAGEVTVTAAPQGDPERTEVTTLAYDAASCT